MTTKNSPTPSYRTVGGDPTMVDHYNQATNDHAKMMDKVEDHKKKGAKVTKDDVQTLFDLVKSTHQGMASLLNRAVELETGDFENLDAQTKLQVEYVLAQMRLLVDATAKRSANMREAYPYLKL